MGGKLYNYRGRGRVRCHGFGDGAREDVLKRWIYLGPSRRTPMEKERAPFRTRCEEGVNVVERDVDLRQVGVKE